MSLARFPPRAPPMPSRKEYAVDKQRAGDHTDSWLYIPFLAHARGLGPPTTFTPPPWWRQAVHQHRQVLIQHQLHGHIPQTPPGSRTTAGPGNAWSVPMRWYIDTPQQEHWMGLGPLGLGQTLASMAMMAKARVQRSMVQHSLPNRGVTAADVGDLEVPTFRVVVEWCIILRLDDSDRHSDSPTQPFGLLVLGARPLFCSVVCHHV